jgi:hypothetical protein
MATVDMNNLPHVCDIHSKLESIVDGDRIAAPEYQKVVSAYRCLMEPMDSETMAGLGYSYDSTVLFMIGSTSIKDTVSTGDICVYAGFAHVVRKFDVYDYGPENMMHIEAVIERLPDVPEGVA